MERIVEIFPCCFFLLFSVRFELLLVTYLLLVVVGLISFTSFECPTRCRHRFLKVKTVSPSTI